MTSSNLELLNAFRVADGLAEITTWKKSRNQPQLDAYMAAQIEETPLTHAEEIEDSEAEVAARIAEEHGDEFDDLNGVLEGVDTSEMTDAEVEQAKVDALTDEAPLPLHIQYPTDDGVIMTNDPKTPKVVTEGFLPAGTELAAIAATQLVNELAAKITTTPKTPVAKGTSKKLQVLAMLQNGGATVKGIADALGIGEVAARSLIGDLKNDMVEVKTVRTAGVRSVTYIAK